MKKYSYDDFILELNTTHEELDEFIDNCEYVLDSDKPKMLNVYYFNFNNKKCLVESGTIEKYYILDDEEDLYEKAKQMAKAIYEIELEVLGLNYYSIGIEKKIHQAIRDNCEEYIEYDFLGEEQYKEMYEWNHSIPKGEWDEELQEYKVPYKWSYDLEEVIRYFENNNTVSYKRKMVEFDNNMYLKKLNEIKYKLEEPMRIKQIEAKKLLEMKEQNKFTQLEEINFGY